MNVLDVYVQCRKPRWSSDFYATKSISVAKTLRLDQTINFSAICEKQDPFLE